MYKYLAFIHVSTTAFEVFSDIYFEYVLGEICLFELEVTLMEASMEFVSQYIQFFDDASTNYPLSHRMRACEPDACRRDPCKPCIAGQVVSHDLISRQTDFQDSSSR